MTGTPTTPDFRRGDGHGYFCSRAMHNRPKDEGTRYPLLTMEHGTGRVELTRSVPRPTSSRSSADSLCFVPTQPASLSSLRDHGNETRSLETLGIVLEGKNLSAGQEARRGIDATKTRTSPFWSIVAACAVHATFIRAPALHEFVEGT